ncbi:unnamed protein product [Polarella glacialis]|uniref:Uncharacterized protein n=1 Tax=Polarella glacialis TaxID=89957 RepID=A0A813DJ75_POLGL|nr:unnamed protein product [Polarella glacialis]
MPQLDRRERRKPKRVWTENGVTYDGKFRVYGGRWSNVEMQKQLLEEVHRATLETVPMDEKLPWAHISNRLGLTKSAVSNGWYHYVLPKLLIFLDDDGNKVSDDTFLRQLIRGLREQLEETDTRINFPSNRHLYRRALSVWPASQSHSKLFEYMKATDMPEDMRKKPFVQRLAFLSDHMRCDDFLEEDKDKLANLVLQTKQKENAIRALRGKELHSRKRLHKHSRVTKADRRASTAGPVENISDEKETEHIPIQGATARSLRFSKKRRVAVLADELSGWNQEKRQEVEDELAVLKAKVLEEREKEFSRSLEPGCTFSGELVEFCRFLRLEESLTSWRKFQAADVCEPRKSLHDLGFPLWAGPCGALYDAAVMMTDLGSGVDEGLKFGEKKFVPEVEALKEFNVVSSLWPQYQLFRRSSGHPDNRISTGGSSSGQKPWMDEQNQALLRQQHAMEREAWLSSTLEQFGDFIVEDIEELKTGTRSLFGILQDRWWWEFLARLMFFVHNDKSLFRQVHLPWLRHVAALGEEQYDRGGDEQLGDGVAQDYFARRRSEEPQQFTLARPLGMDFLWSSVREHWRLRAMCLRRNEEMQQPLLYQKPGERELTEADESAILQQTRELKARTEVIFEKVSVFLWPAMGNFEPEPDDAKKWPNIREFITSSMQLADSSEEGLHHLLQDQYCAGSILAGLVVAYPAHVGRSMTGLHLGLSDSEKQLLISVLPSRALALGDDQQLLQLLWLWLEKPKDRAKLEMGKKSGRPTQKQERALYSGPIDLPPARSDEEELIWQRLITGLLPAAELPSTADLQRLLPIYGAWKKIKGTDQQQQPDQAVQSSSITAPSLGRTLILVGEGTETERMARAAAKGLLVAKRAAEAQRLKQIVADARIQAGFDAPELDAATTGRGKYKRNKNNNNNFNNKQNNNSNNNNAAMEPVAGCDEAAAGSPESLRHLLPVAGTAPPRKRQKKTVAPELAPCSPEEQRPSEERLPKSKPAVASDKSPSLSEGMPQSKRGSASLGPSSPEARTPKSKRAVASELSPSPSDRRRPKPKGSADDDSDDAPAPKAKAKAAAAKPKRSADDDSDDAPRLQSEVWKSSSSSKSQGQSKSSSSQAGSSSKAMAKVKAAAAKPADSDDDSDDAPAPKAKAKAAAAKPKRSADDDSDDAPAPQSEVWKSSSSKSQGQGKSSSSQAGSSSSSKAMAKAKAAAAKPADSDDDSDDAPAPKAKAKAKAAAAKVADSDDEIDDAPSPKARAKAKAKAAVAKPVDSDDEIDDAQAAAAKPADSDDDSDDEPAPKAKAKARVAAGADAFAEKTVSAAARPPDTRPPAASLSAEPRPRSEVRPSDAELMPPPSMLPARLRRPVQNQAPAVRGPSNAPLSALRPVVKNRPRRAGF